MDPEARNAAAASRLANKERRTFARLLKKHAIDRRQLPERVSSIARRIKAEG